MATVPLGVLKQHEKPVYEDGLLQQNEEALAKQGEGDLAKLLRGRETWEV